MESPTKAMRSVGSAGAAVALGAAAAAHTIKRAEAAPDKPDENLIRLPIASAGPLTSQVGAGCGVLMARGA